MLDDDVAPLEVRRQQRTLDAIQAPGRMPSASALIVAHRTAGTPGFSDEVRSHAAHERCRFVLLLPRPYRDPRQRRGR